MDDKDDLPGYKMVMFPAFQLLAKIAMLK